MFKNFRYFLISFLISFLLFFIACNKATKESEQAQSELGERLISAEVSDGLTGELPQSDADSGLINSEFYKQEIARIKNAISKPNPIILREDLDISMSKAQTIAIQDSSFQKYLLEPKSKKKIRSEIFGVYPARQSDFNQQTASQCSDGNCYRVEMYNYPLNMASVALVSVSQNKVLSCYYANQTQPDIPPSKKQLALQIAVNSKLVQNALGYTPSQSEALMSDTKTALNRSRCERSKHLCVAPTFIKGDKALWAIVDLTDLKVVGVRWTNVGGVPTRVTERKIQNEKITDCYCKKLTNLKKNNWDMNYMLTSNDGLRVSEVKYMGKNIIQNAKLVDWHVSYSNTDGFGYSDAVGCPYFSTAAVIAIETPKVKSLVENGKEIGFVVEQYFYSEGWPQPCNYNYLQRFEFYNDGKFRVSCASLGRGCGNNGTYRPVMRIAFAGNNSISEWKNNNWNIWNNEQYSEQTASTQYTPEGYQFKISNDQNYYIEPSRGQFKDNGRGDNAFVYVTYNNPTLDEGESDLVTIGPCCNTDYKQGPEKFIEPTPDNIQNKPLVLWYVGQMKNDDTKGREYCWAEAFINDKGVYSTKSYPCFIGPMFVPVK